MWTEQRQQKLRTPFVKLHRSVFACANGLRMSELVDNAEKASTGVIFGPRQPSHSLQSVPMDYLYHEHPWSPRAFAAFGTVAKGQ